ncbi:PQQ-dependent sugar dehydrogenase [Mucilaginibacter psychrotolerans]|uniref:PQQ-dependent sugar dehydrogenase n=1 Tax=Mucilaginibacter psychrotolerans TaxID=1524096 RepID=UPI0019594011|nr:PQQ-dependent sugar dehydrogenase [Mucilaginibacter psychrotolerans]
MLVTEKPGTIRIVTTAGVVSAAIDGVPPVKYRSNSGLQDIVLDPDFASTRLVFWSFVEPITPTSFVTSIARVKLSANETKFEDVTIIYRANPSYTGYQHPGSQLLFCKNGYLFACFGERYDDVIRIQAQYLSSPLGKIVRIKKDGTAAPGGPFAATPGALPEIWSLGHRDPQGLAFNPVTGDLWESEHGPMAGDEINLIRPGYNYGWPVIAYGYENSGPLVGKTVGNGTKQEGMKQPVYYWDPAIAPSGIAFYTGTQVPEWKNNLFVAALKGKHIVRLVLYGNQVFGEERLLAAEGQRFRKVIQGPDGALYALTDQTVGRIYRIGAK